MSYKTQQPYRWPSPPLQSDRQEHDSPTSSISPLTTRRQFDHAVPTGTVASRVKHLQSLGSFLASEPPSENPRDHDDLSDRTSLGRRISSRFAEPASRSSKPTEEPQVDHSHSYLGRRTSRTNHREEHALTDGNRSYGRISSSGIQSRIEPRALPEKVENDVANPWAFLDKRKLDEYSKALRDYSRQEMNRISEADSHNAHAHLLRRSDFVDDFGQATTDTDRTSHPETLRKADDASVETASTNRHESVRDLYKEYGISRPPGLISSSEQTPDNSILNEPLLTDDKDRNSPPSLRTPIADSFMREKQEACPPPVPPPVPSPKRTDPPHHHSQHVSRKISTATQLPRPSSSRPEQKLVRSEVARHQNAKTIHNRKQLARPSKPTPKTSENPRYETSYAEGVKDHLSTPMKHTGQHSRRGPAPRVPRKHSNPHVDKHSEHLRHAKEHGDLIRKRTSVPEHLAPKSSYESVRSQPRKPDTPHVAHQSTAARHKTNQPELHHAKHQKHEIATAEAQHAPRHATPPRQVEEVARTPESNFHLTEHQRSKMATAEAQHAQRNTTPPVAEVQAESKTPEPSPAEHFGDETSDAQHNSSHVPLSPSQAQVRTRPDGCTSIMKSVAEISTPVNKRGDRSQYFTTPEQPVTIDPESHAATPDEEFSLLLSSSPALRAVPAELVPRRHHSPKHHSRHSRRSGHHHHRSPSSSVSSESPASTCGSPTCRATHSGHAPYRHSISCTEKRLQRHIDKDNVYAEGMSHFEEDAHPHVYRRSSRQYHVHEHRPGHHNSKYAKLDSYQDSSCHESTPSSSVIKKCRHCSGFVDRCRHYPDDCQCDSCQSIYQSVHHHERSKRDREHRSSHHHHSTGRSQTNPTKSMFLRSSSSSPQITSSRSSTPHPGATPISSAVLTTVPKNEGSYEQHYAATGHQHLPKTSRSILARFQSSRRLESTALSQMSTPQSVVSASGPILSPMPQRRDQSPSWTRTSIASVPVQTPIVSPWAQQVDFTPMPDSQRLMEQSDHDQSSQSWLRSQTPGHQKNIKSLTAQHTQYGLTASQSKDTHQVPRSQPESVAPIETMKRQDVQQRRPITSNTEQSTVRRRPMQDPRPSSPVKTIQSLQNARAIANHSPTPDLRTPTPLPWAPLRKAPDLPASKPTMPQHRSTSSFAVRSILDSPSVYTTSSVPLSPAAGGSNTPKTPRLQNETPNLPKSPAFVKAQNVSSDPQVPQRRSLRSTQPSRPHTSMELSPKTSPPISRPHTSMESRPRTPSIGAASTHNSGQSSPVSKPMLRRLTPPDVRDDDKKSRSRSVSNKISTLFQLKEKKSIPLLNHKLQEHLEEQKRMKTENKGKFKERENKKSKGLKLKDVEKTLKDRRWSLKLKDSKELKPEVDVKKRDLREEDAGFMAVQNSDIPEDGRDDQTVEKKFEDDVERHGEVSQRESDDTQDWSQSGKGLHDSSTPERENRTLKAVGDRPPKSGEETGRDHSMLVDGQFQVNAPIQQQASAGMSNRNRPGLVSSKVKEWDRELAERAKLEKNSSSRLGGKQQFRTSSETYRTESTETRHLLSQQRPVEDPIGQQRSRDTAKVDSKHDCVWKTMYLSQRKQDVKMAKNERPELKEKSVVERAESDESEIIGGLLGITILVHRKGKEDLVVKTALQD